jgi:hypothetical protein
MPPGPHPPEELEIGRPRIGSRRINPDASSGTC